MTDSILTQRFFDFPLIWTPDQGDSESPDDLINRSNAVRELTRGNISLDDFLDFLEVEQGYDLDAYQDLLTARLVDLYQTGDFLDFVV